MRRAPLVLAVVLVVLGASARAAYAAESSAGSAALRQARDAWERGALEAAEDGYREALEKGGLAPEEVVEGYVRMGAVRASLGKKDAAVRAFKAASILDSSFTVPTQAGPKGSQFAAQAKRETARIGSIQLTMSAPKEASAGKSFNVTAQLDAAHVPIVAKVTLLARDGTSGKEASAEAKAAESVELEVPSDVTLPSANLLVRIDAIDTHGNRLASTEERVRVPDAPRARASTSRGDKSSSSSSSAAADGGVRKGGGFWSSPWPYVIGGVALAGVGAALYFGTRPSDEVSVGAVAVSER